ncbi:MAG: cytochrome c biogenesis heme-transporting ATPase CcmA [Pseudomonadales bacterium]|nr:cytochrome c biogenesis heme-transporting ATPase CcmA [Pseudomonadales bacterium]
MLDVKNLYCERNQGLLFEALSFSLKPGKVIQIKGPNGAGKTTLLRILCGLFGEFEGEVLWDLEKHPIYLGHKAGVKDLLTVTENLNWLCELQQNYPSSDQIKKALIEVGLLAYKDVMAGQLSEGQKKRVSLARLYLINSPVWLLDEPFSAIDVEGLTKLEERMRGYVEGGGSIILTSHQMVNIDQDVTELLLKGANSC